MGKRIPEATGAILRQWQAQGLKFNWLGSPGGGHLGFDGEIEDYEIVEQPIPKGMTVDQVQGMWERGLKLAFDSENDTWDVQKGYYCIASLLSRILARMRIPAQPIPEKLLQEPGQEEAQYETEAEFRERNKDAKKITQTTRFKTTVESDPNGLDPHAPGAKLDAGKNRLGLVLGGFANALEAVGLVGTYGAEKYTPNGWKEVPDGVARYEDAMMRHWIEVKKGNEIDSTTMLSHRAQLIWNALAALELLATWED